jgi:maleylpyruvate isomerase
VQEPLEVLDAVIASTGALLRDVEGLTDGDAAATSLLPGWTRGHVLTHLARNAEGGTRLLTWARTGVPSHEYPSATARDADIEAGSKRPAATLLEDVSETAAEFAAAAASVPRDAWGRPVRYTNGTEHPAEVILSARLSEVLIHHVDLDLAFTPRDWPGWFTRERLTRTAASLTTRHLVEPAVRLEATDTDLVVVLGTPADADLPVVAGLECDLMAWLYGRSDGSILTRHPPGPLPEIPPIY